jgi:hypothetical protein
VPYPFERAQLLLAGEQVRGPQQDRELRQFRRLDLQRPEVDPPPRVGYASMRNRRGDARIASQKIGTPTTTNSISRMSWVQMAECSSCDTEIVVDAAISTPKPSRPPPASSINCTDAYGRSR